MLAGYADSAVFAREELSGNSVREETMKTARCELLAQADEFERMAHSAKTESARLRHLCLARYWSIMANEFETSEQSGSPSFTGGGSEGHRLQAAA